MFGTSKKFYAFALVAVLLLALVVVVAAGCGSSSTTTTTAAPATTTTAAAGTTTTAAAGTTTTAAGESTTTTAVNATGLAGKHFAYVTIYTALAAGLQQQLTLVNEIEKRGGTVTVTSGNGDYNKVITLWEQAISQKVDAIINGAVPSNMLGSAITDAKAAGIPVFVSNGQPDPNEVAASHQNATEMDNNLCDIFLNAIGNKGNIVEATQSDDWLIVQISAAIHAKIGAVPAVKVLQDVHPDHKNDVDALKTAMTAILTANPTPGSVVGGIAAWGDPAAGMAQACEAANRTEVKIVGSDGIEAEMEQMLLPKPVEIATMHQDWVGLATKLCDTMVAWFDGSNKQYGQEYVVPSAIIDTPALAQEHLTYLQNFVASLSTTTT